jgi:uncharacterized protein (DUF342 family)
MRTLSVAGVERLQYEQGINASNLGVANVYADIQEKHGDLVGETMQENEQVWKEFLQENTGATMAASGATGKSAQRIASLDLAKYLTKTSRNARELTDATHELRKEGSKAAGQAAAQQEQMFAKQAWVKTPGMAPPQPVMQNVGAAAFMDALSIGGKIATIGGSGGLNWFT